jgi:hypothetical protein
MSLGKVYYDPKHSGFGIVSKLVKGSENKRSDIEEWLSGQDAYTPHRAVRKRFP